MSGLGRRAGRAAALALVSCLALAGVAGCSDSGSGSDGSASSTVADGPISFDFAGDAATIAGQGVPAKVIADTLAVFKAAPEALQPAFGETELNQVGTDQPNPTIVANILTTEISVRVIQAELTRRGVTVPPGATQVAETQMKGYFGTALDSQPDYQKVLIDRYALYVTLDQALQGPPPSEAQLRADYDKDPSRFEQACARHILVKTEAEAKDLLTQLQAGADFAALATAKSTDTGSAAKGGDLGCQARGVYVEAFEQAVWNGPLNAVQGPVKTDFGFHLIEVTKRGPRSFEEAHDDVANALAPEPFAALGEWLHQTLGSAAITVDDRFGTWDAATGQVNPKGVSTTGLSIVPENTSSTAPGAKPSTTIGATTPSSTSSTRS